MWSTAKEQLGLVCARGGSPAAGLRQGAKVGAPIQKLLQQSGEEVMRLEAEEEAEEDRGKGEPMGLDCGVRKGSVKDDSEALRTGDWKDGVATK